MTPLTAEQQKLVVDSYEVAVGYGRRFAKKVRRPDALDDFIQAALEGLVAAAGRFKAERGVEFTTYAHYWMNYLMSLEMRRAQIVLLTAYQHEQGLRANSTDEAVDYSPVQASVVLDEVYERELQRRTAVWLKDFSARDRALTDAIVFGDHTQAEAARRFGVTDQRVDQIMNKVRPVVRERFLQEAA